MASYDMMRTYLDLVVAGDFEDAMGYMSDDITVHFSGWKTTHGKEEYRAALGEVMQAVGTIEVREHDLLVSDDHAVVLNSWHITSDDRDQWLNNAIVYHTADGKITDLWILSEDQKAMAELMA